jgi:hypothetical protein
MKRKVYADIGLALDMFEFGKTREHLQCSVPVISGCISEFFQTR